MSRHRILIHRTLIACLVAAVLGILSPLAAIAGSVVPDDRFPAARIAACTLQEDAMSRHRTALLLRAPSTDHGTLGQLRCGIRAALTLATMEPPWRDNARGRSCIPAGDYDVVPHVSPRYGECYLVTGTAPRTHILVHPGNVGGDTDLGLHTHTLGCLLPGLRQGWLTVRGQRQRAVLASRTACRHLARWAAGMPFRLEVRDAG